MADDTVSETASAPASEASGEAVVQHADPRLLAARAEADELTTRILELRDAYYERDEELVSDAEYDAMMRRLEELERA